MPTERPLSADQITAFHRDGYVVVPGFFEVEEFQPALDAMETDPTFGGMMIDHNDGSERSRHGYLVWTEHADDWLGVITRLARMVENSATLLGEPVYHFHSKIVRKPAGESGEVVWHQDFGGWYEDGCLMPDMLTVGLALSAATEESGCLHMLKGSHMMGRVDRVRDEHTYANMHPQREAAMLRRFEEESIEMAPGDGIFFHANTAHFSDRNRSRYDRSLMLFSYNTVSNSPVFDNQEHHAFKPLEIAPDDALRVRAYDGIFDKTPLVDTKTRNDKAATIIHRDQVAAHN